MKLFVDMDGVLADFDAHYAATFGVRPCKVKDDVDWDAVRAIPGFYANIPPMADMMTLWDAIKPYNPTVLTGVPSSVPEAHDNKRAWVVKNLGPDVPIITCKSRDKSLHANPGDVIIDDWDKYRHLWLAKGGHWILHTSAADSVAELNRLVQP